MTTSLHAIPPEIQDSILDELGAMLSMEDRKDAHSALLACHRASRSLRPRVLRYLYQKIRFSNADLSQSTRPIKTISILKDIIISPTGTLGSVGPYVKSLFMTFQKTTSGSEVKKIPLDTKRIADEIVKFLGDEDVLAVLQALCRQEYGVKDFVLSLVIAPESERAFYLLDYAGLPKDFRTAFVAFARSPHMHSLQIQHEDPFRCLIATRLSSIASTGSQGVNRRRASQIEYDDRADDYSVEMCTDYAFPYGEMLPQSHYSRLSSLVAYNTGSKHASRTWKTVYLSSQNLCSLSIFQYGRMAVPLQSFNFTRLPKLESFTFLHAISQNERLNDRWSDGANELTLGLLYQLFNITSPMNSFALLDLRLEFTEARNRQPFIERIGPWWDLLDQCLSGPFFPILRQVRFKVRVELVKVFSEHFDEGVYVERTIQLLKQHFWRLSARSGVHFLVDVVPTVYYVQVRRAPTP